MQFAALGDFDSCAQHFVGCRRERFSGIAAVGQYILHFCQIIFAQGKSLQSAGAIRDIGGRDMDHVRQTVGIDTNVALDAGHQFTAVKAFVLCRVRVLYTLRINDQKCSVRVPPKASPYGANHIFLTPPPRGYVR